MKQLVGRFAPSPSGRMHLGNVYAALLSYLCVKSQKGQWLLRLEDLDPLRCPRSYGDLILEDLRWLGLAWDNPELVYQSERSSLYQKYARELQKKDLTYPCFCSRGALHAAEAPHASDGRPVYAGTCRYLSRAEIAEKLLLRAPALRVKVPWEEKTYQDGFYGTYKFNLARDWGDFLIQRSDGVWAYQLAVTVDDALMGVNQVVRGRDLLTSSPVQMYLQQQLGFPVPEYLHLPLLLAPGGARLAKRDQAADLGCLREHFKTPERLLGFLGYLTGQLPQLEPVSLEELTERFNLQRLPREDITVSEELLASLA